MRGRGQQPGATSNPGGAGGRRGLTVHMVVHRRHPAESNGAGPGCQPGPPPQQEQRRRIISLPPDVVRRELHNRGNPSDLVVLCQQAVQRADSKERPCLTRRHSTPTAPNTGQSIGTSTTTTPSAVTARRSSRGTG